jgi:hypothetical protein
MVVMVVVVVVVTEFPFSEELVTLVHFLFTLSLSVMKPQRFEPPPYL